MLGKLHDALLAAGAPPDKARNASEEVAAYDRDPWIAAELTLHRWVFGVVIALEFAIIGMIFQIISKLP